MPCHVNPVACALSMPARQYRCAMRRARDSPVIVCELAIDQLAGVDSRRLRQLLSGIADEGSRCSRRYCLA